MIHTFSVVVENDSEVNRPTIELDLLEGADNFGIVRFSAGIISVKVAPITGLHRQHLIGESEDHV